eukprot:jgi/Chlat1/1274/Chrsp117S01708
MGHAAAAAAVAFCVRPATTLSCGTLRRSVSRSLTARLRLRTPPAPCTSCCHSSSSNASSSSAETETTQAQGLLHWVEANDGSVRAGVEITPEGDGWGLRLGQHGKAAARGEVLMRLPSKLTLGEFSAEADVRKVLSKMAAPIPEALWSLRLGLHLLHQRALEDSFYWPYISLLPNAYGVPIFFGTQAVQALQCQTLQKQVALRSKFLQAFATRLAVERGAAMADSMADPFMGQDVSPNELAWAMAAVSSRAFRLDGSKKPASMLPAVDMMNHSFNPNTTVERQQDGSAAIKALSPIEAGEYLTTSYGDLSNELLLLDYGFVISDNLHDVVELVHDGDVVDSSAYATFGKDAQERLARLQGMNSGVTYKISARPPHADARLITLARLLSASPSELRDAKGLKSLQAFGDWKRPLSSESEQRALQCLSAILALSLNKFPTTIYNDLDMLTAPGRAELLEPDMRAALQFRVQQKRVLIAAIQYLSRAAHEKADQAAGTPESRRGKGFGARR